MNLSHLITQTRESLNNGNNDLAKETLELIDDMLNGGTDE